MTNEVEKKLTTAFVRHRAAMQRTPPVWQEPMHPVVLSSVEYDILRAGTTTPTDLNFDHSDGVLRWRNIPFIVDRRGK